ncbi:MAG TPA: c-type cytochrome [Longimicrobiaceae bacterium]
MTIQKAGVRATLAVTVALSAACQPPAPPAPSAPLPSTTALPADAGAAPVLAPAEALASFRLPEGYRVELVAAEPLVQDPVAIDFDADGRMYVAEMRGYMPNLAGEGEDQRIGRIVVLEDLDDDGAMDRKTVFMDSLVLPRSVKVLSHGVLVAATPNLWLARDTDGDLRADTVVLLRDDYGNPQSNPEHNANGLLWGMDNWIHNANFAGQFRLRDGELHFRPVASQGQWGVSMDDFGRLFRNSNSDPLRADLIPSHYAQRNTAQAGMRGVYERLTPNVPVWPVRPTPGVNRGYQERVLREDLTLAQYTAAGSPTAYVGDRLPAELRNNVFVAEAAGNVVGRFVVSEDPDGMLSARPAYERSDFLASTDERFRPVFISSAPDGTLYVVDMYRGIIQHRAYVTGYLEDQIRKRGLEQPVGLGRIYRIVHESTRRGERPDLSARSPAQLVRLLAHPNGWWRITAQRLLVERGDRSVAPALRRMALRDADERARLHALWTLEGLGEADAATLQSALRDRSPHVRAAAVRVSEPFLAGTGGPMESAILALVEDPAPVVRRQVAATLGEIPEGRRIPALLAVTRRHGDDPIVADLVVSALQERELALLEAIMAQPDAGSERAGATVQALARTVLQRRDGAEVQRLLGWATDPARPRALRLALLDGMSAPGAGRGGPGAAAFARRGGGSRAVEIAARPEALLALTESADSALGNRARGVAEALAWPGKPAPPMAPRPELTAEEERRVALGAQVYAGACAACHQAEGQGLEGVAKSLVGSEWALAVPAQVIRIVLHGKEGEMLMPPVGGAMTDEQVAAVLTYVRRSGGNQESAIAPAEVAEVRGSSGPRTQAWTEAELRRIRR